MVNRWGQIWNEKSHKSHHDYFDHFQKFGGAIFSRNIFIPMCKNVKLSVTKISKSKLPIIFPFIFPFFCWFPVILARTVPILPYRSATVLNPPPQMAGWDFVVSEKKFSRGGLQSPRERYWGRWQKEVQGRDKEGWPHVGEPRWLHLTSWALGDRTWLIPVPSANLLVSLNAHPPPKMDHFLWRIVTFT